MRCPRCDGTLSTFAVEDGTTTAVVCESCGFAGVPASHRSEDWTAETWEEAIEGFDETVLPPERTCRTGRAKTVSVPGRSEDSAADGISLDESVSVAVSLHNGTDEEGDDTEGKPDPE